MQVAQYKENKMLHGAILFTLFVTSHAWILRTNREEISPGTSKDVYLLCHWDAVSENKPKHAEIERLVTILITKLDPFGSEMTFAGIYISTNDTFQLDDGVIVTSNIKTKQKAFLKVTWPIASKTTAGPYGCEISGYDKEDSFVSLKVTPVVIKEKLLTEKEVRQFIRETILPVEKNHQSLKVEFANFKESLSTELEGLKRQIQNEDTIIKRNITKLKQYVESTFITEDKFRDQISDVRNFTINRIISDNRNDETTHNNIYEAIQSTEESCRKNYTSVWSAHETLKNSISKEIDLLEKKAIHNDAQTNNKLAKLSEALHAIDSKFENITNSLAVELENHQRIVSSTRKPVTKSKPTQTESEKWPNGLYSLVRAPTGCPMSKLSNGTKLFSKAPAKDYIYANDKDEKLNPTDYMKLWVRLGKAAYNLDYCRKSVAETTDSTPWPNGSYCITIEGRKCLEGFHLEVLTYMITVDKHVHFFNTPYCCRSDGSASSPINLPTTAPFYLFRYGNECQKVVGMDVREDLSELSPIAEIKIKVRYHAHQGHDKDNADKPLRHLCHYKAIGSGTK